jgi:lipooligosaccharide transport system permease protein
MDLALCSFEYWAYSYRRVWRGSIATGILAATAMQIGTFESSYPITAAICWTRQFHAMLATPLRVRDLIVGHQLYVACRLAVVGGIYLVILAVFGVLHSPLAILALPSVVLVGLAYSGPVSAFSAWLERDEGFNALFRFGVIPMFLFSGTFFPVTRLPHSFREIAYATPLWNGVDLTRQFTRGTATLSRSLAHTAYLLLWIAAGHVLAHRTFRRRLVT